MMAKLKADDPSLKDQEALDYALHAKNMETTNKGFSPFQIVYGSNPKIPGIMNSNPPCVTESFESIIEKKPLESINMARESLRKNKESS